MSVLTPEQKKAVFNKIKKTSDDALHKALTAAALNNEPFPIDNNDFSNLCGIYARMGVASVKLDLNNAITNLISEKIVDEFQAALSESFEPDKWQSSFLVFLANQLNIELKKQPLVQMTIKNGKVYWRIMNGEQVVYDRIADKNNSTPFDFNGASTVSMTWEQFREFKDSGKRNGSVSISKEKFVNALADQNKTTVGYIWNVLKDEGVFDHNNRLSHMWRFASSIKIKPPIDKDWYPLISDAFNRISTNPKNAERFDWIPNAEIYRPERTLKKWARTGLIVNYAPKTSQNMVKQWDVGVYSEQNSHAEVGDGLEHDHIPSTSFLKSQKKLYVNQFRLAAIGSKSTQKSTEYNQEAKEFDAEKNEHWWCIAMPTALHKQGISHGESSGMQQKQIKKPFFDEVNDYLDKLELQWLSSPINDNEYIKALGAFRYMYRSQMKSTYGLTPNKFFNETVNTQDLDALFYERLKKFMAKKEGEVKEPHSGMSATM